MSMAIMMAMQFLNGSLGRSSNKDSQKLQQEFQSAMQARQWEETARLQREIQALNARSARDNARETFQRQQRQFEEQAFLGTWPLQGIDPLTIRRDFQKALDEGRPIPLQVIIPALEADLKLGGRFLVTDVRLALETLAVSMAQFYPDIPHADTPVRVYTNCARANMTFGTTQLSTLYEIFHVAPTLVMLPQCQNGDKFTLRAAYWDGSDAEKSWSPFFLPDIFSCSVRSQTRQALRDKALDWKVKKERFRLENDALDKLYSLVEEESREVEEKKTLGLSEADIEEHIFSKYDQRYGVICKEGSISVDDEIREMLNASCKVSVSLLTDMHYLAHGSHAPKSLDMCREELGRFPELLQTAEQLFQKVLCLTEQQSLLPASVLGHARIARAYASAAQNELALSHRNAGLKQLRKLVPSPEAGNWAAVPELSEAVQILEEENASPGDDYLQGYLKELRRDSASLNASASLAYKDGDYRRACDFWLRSAQQNNAQACYNLSLMYGRGQGVQKNHVQAAYYMEKALEYGSAAAVKQIDCLVAFYLCEGDWIRAFDFCLRGLAHAETPQSTQNKLWVKSSVLMLTSVADDIPAEQRKRWLEHAQRSLRQSLSSQACAIQMLQNMADEDEEDALDALILILGKRCEGGARHFAPLPLFSGTSDPENVRLAWNCQLSDEHLDILKDYMARSADMNTPRHGEWSSFSLK